MAEFSRAINTILKNEGGYVNNPNDPGGETNYGISKRSFPDVDIRNLTQEKAIAIYRASYWGKYPLLDQLDSQEVATKVFDLMVNMGGPPRSKSSSKASTMRAWPASSGPTVDSDRRRCNMPMSSTRIDY